MGICSYSLPVEADYLVRTLAARNNVPQSHIISTALILLAAQPLDEGGEPDPEIMKLAEGLKVWAKQRTQTLQSRADKVAARRKKFYDETEPTTEVQDDGL